MPRKNAKKNYEVKDNHWRNHMQNIENYVIQSAEIEYSNTESNYPKKKSKKNNYNQHENNFDNYNEFNNDNYYHYDNNYNHKKNKNEKTFQSTYWQKDSYANYNFKDQFDEKINKIKNKKEKNFNKKIYNSPAQFFQHFVENNSFSYNPNLPVEESFEKLIDHLAIRSDKKQCEKLKEKLDKAKAFEEPKPNITSENKIKSNEIKNGENLFQIESESLSNEKYESIININPNPKSSNTKENLKFKHALENKPIELKLNKKQRLIQDRLNSYQEENLKKFENFEIEEENNQSIPDYFESEDLQNDIFNDFGDFYDQKTELEESFSGNAYVAEELADYEEVKKVYSVAEFFEFYKKKYGFKIKKKFESPDFHLSNFYKLADYMQWANLLSEKKLFFKQLDRESKIFYLRKNFRKFNLVYRNDMPLKKNFFKLCDYMQWEDLYNLFYELFIDLLDNDLENERKKNDLKEDEFENKGEKEVLDIDNQNKKVEENKKNENEISEEFFTILNQDLEKMYCEISATADENKRITKTVDLIEEFIAGYFPQCSLDPFGSFTQGLHLRDSDIDIAVYDKPIENLLKEKKKENIRRKGKKDSDYGFSSPDKKLLSEIKKKLIRTNFASYNSTWFINAKVPIIKTKCKKTGVNIDISVNQINGNQAKNYINKALGEFPKMRTIIKIIKYILRLNHLNETVSGGIGSFLIFNLVYAYFLYLRRKHKEENGTSNTNIDQETNLTDIAGQTNKKDEGEQIFESQNKKEIECKKTEFLKENKSNPFALKINIDCEETKISKLFLGFLNFYANEFDYENFGISNIGEGNFFRKKENEEVKYTENLCVVNFLEQTSNIAKPVIKYHRVINLFKDIIFNFKFAKISKIKNGIFDDILQKVKRTNYY